LRVSIVKAASRLPILSVAGKRVGHFAVRNTGFAIAHTGRTFPGLVGLAPGLKIVLFLKNSQRYRIVAAQTGSVAMTDRRVEKWTRNRSMAREFAVDLGDVRRNRRAQEVGLALVAKPQLSLPKVFEDEAQLQAVYDLLRNDAVAWRDVVKPHAERTHQRARVAGDVLAVHDTTDVAFRLYWPDEQREHMISMSTRTQGFFLHTSLCVTATGPVLPLGLLDLQPYVNRKKLEASSVETQKFWEMEAGVFDNEQERWFRSIAVADDELGQYEVRPIHVMDRETDSYGLLSWMAHHGFRFVVRCDDARKLRCDEEMRAVGVVDVELGERFPLRSGSKGDTHPPRRARNARLTVRSAVVTLRRTPKVKDQSWSPPGFEQPKTLKLNLVEAIELNPPAGEKAVRWLLLTQEPIGTEAEVLRVLDWYRRRWIIEEFFKAAKTGCSLEKRQMDSAATMLRMMALLLPSAWRLLLLRSAAQQMPDLAWHHLLTPLEFRILQRMLPKFKLTKTATVAQCFLAIARLGGHLKRNGSPGWQTLQSGWARLQELSLGAKVGRRDAINA
jgi:hypothetical protein